MRAGEQASGRGGFSLYACFCWFFSHQRRHPIEPAAEAAFEMRQSRRPDQRLAGHSIRTIAFDSGFSDLSSFNRAFRRRFGMTPSEARHLT
jgi:AraC-like DNA-binding protein